MSIATLIGMYYVIKKIVWMFSWFWRHFCRPLVQSRTRMLDRYGEKDKTWALVTGGSDGIGLAMCENLAK